VEGRLPSRNCQKRNSAINAVGIGFQRGTHANWQLVTNDGTGAPTLTDMGAPFAIATGGVLTLFIAAPPNAASVWVWAVSQHAASGTGPAAVNGTTPPSQTHALTPVLCPRLG
jgi:hypothetical protein